MAVADNGDSGSAEPYRDHQRADVPPDRGLVGPAWEILADALLENTVEAVVLCDGNGAVLRASRAAIDLAGRDPLHLPFERAFPVQLRAGTGAIRQLAVDEILTGVRLRAAEAVLHRSDGRAFHLHVTAQPLRLAPDAPRGALLQMLDVTRRVEAEQSQRASEEALRRSDEALREARRLEGVARLAGGIAHELNNVLTVICGYGALVTGLLEPAHPAQKLLREINQGSERLTQLTRQLLSHSGKLMPVPEVLDLIEVVERTRPLMRRAIGDAVELVVQRDAGPALVHVDRSQIEQVLLNLVLGARDAMPGGGRLTVEVREVDSPETWIDSATVMPAGRYVRLTVSDTGDVTARSTEQGHGGLAAVQALVRQCGGFVQKVGRTGHGSRVEVHLHARSPVRPVAPQQPAGLGRMPPGFRPTLLLVEDEEGVREFAKTVLEAACCRVLAAETGEEALSIVESHGGPIDAVVTDVIMPGLDGVELVRRLRLRHPQMRVLFISGHTQDTLQRLQVGLDDAALLVKPFSPHTLCIRVAELLGQAVAGYIERQMR